MKNKISPGSVCALVIFALWIGGMIAFVPPLSSEIVQALPFIGMVFGGAATVFAVAVMFGNWVAKSDEKMQDLVAKSAAWIIAIFMLGALGFLAFEVFVKGIDSLVGKPIDEFGTIVPLSAQAAGLVIIISVSAAYCFTKHVALPVLRQETKHKIGLKAAIGFLWVFFAMFALQGSIIGAEYKSQNPAIVEAVAIREMTKLQERLAELKADKESRSKNQ